MAGIRYNHNTFSVGMISEKIQGNTESETYNNSLLDCKNFYIRQTGGVFKRPGTIFVSDIKNSLRMKLYPYHFAKNDSIVIGIIPGEIFAYNTEGQVANCRAEVLGLQVIQDEHFTVLQNGNFLYIFSSAGLYKLKYDTETSTLTFSKQEFTFAPVGKTNTDRTAEAVFVKTTSENGGTIKLTGEYKFVPSDIGQRCLLTWLNIKGEIGKDQPQDYSYFKITSIDETGKIANVTFEKDYSSFLKIEEVPTSPTQYFALPAFGANRGWPVAAGILANRLFLADNENIVYGSSLVFNDIFDFSLIQAETSGIFYAMNNDIGEINWIIGQEKLFVGTPTGIYISGGSGTYQDEVLLQSNMSLKKFSSVHASHLQPTNINGNIIFSDALSKNIFEIAVDESTGTYRTYDLSLLSSELLNSTCVSQTWSSYPVKTYWCVTGDGKLASMTYEKANNVLAWSYHELGGQNTAVESCATIQMNGYDYVFLVVRRNIGGQIVRFIEYIDKLFEPLDNKQYQQHYADAGLVRKYEYHIANISQYRAPQINNVNNWEFDQIQQNEDAKTQYVEMALLNYQKKKTKFELYPDKTWTVTAADGTTTNYISFCGLKRFQKQADKDRIQRTYEEKQPLDANCMTDFTDDECQLAIRKDEIDGVLYDKNDNELILLCDSSYFAVGDYIVFRDTGIKDGKGEPLDTIDNPEVLMVYGTNVSAYTKNFGIIVRRQNESKPGYTVGSFLGKGPIYRYRGKNKYKLIPGKNTVVTQHVPMAEAVALSSLPNVDDMPKYGICGGVVFDFERKTYNIAQDQKIYEVLTDFSKWSPPVLEASSDIKALIGKDEYFTTTSFVRGKVTVSLGGKFQKFISKTDQNYFFISGGKICSINGTNVSRNDKRDNITASVLIDGGQKQIQWFAPKGVFGCWKPGGGETSIGTLREESRTVNDGIAIGDKVYIVGEQGLFYQREKDNLLEWTYLENEHTCDWKGVVQYGSNILLWSQNGELLLYRVNEQSYSFQTVIISSNVSGCYVANNTVFLALSDGTILRSISDSEYTLTFFDLSSIYIDDVVGMEGVNGKKYLVKNINNSKLAEGYIEYELWNSDSNPLDSRELGVYDTTVRNNGTAHVYFNKIVGLGHLAAQKVTVSLDGNFLMNTTVSNAGIVTFSNDVYGMECHIGYQYTGVLDLMPLSGGNVRGSSVGSVGSQKSAFARLYYSLGGTYGTESDNMYKIIYPTKLTKGRYDNVKKLYSGVIELPLVNPRDVRERKFRMEHSEPVSFNVLSITQDAEISDA